MQPDKPENVNTLILFAVIFAILLAIMLFGFYSLFIPLIIFSILIYIYAKIRTPDLFSKIETTMNELFDDNKTNSSKEERRNKELDAIEHEIAIKEKLLRKSELEDKIRRLDRQHDEKQLLENFEKEVKLKAAKRQIQDDIKQEEYIKGLINKTKRAEIIKKVFADEEEKTRMKYGEPFSLSQDQLIQLAKELEDLEDRMISMLDRL